MNILEIFGAKVKEAISQNEQATNELIIELATFFYKIDKRVSLQEQEYMESLMADMNWSSSISIEAFQNACIARVNEVVSPSEAGIHSYLTKLMEALADSGGVEQAKKIAKEISDADGEIADDEVKYLDFVMAFE